MNAPALAPEQADAMNAPALAPEQAGDVGAERDDALARAVDDEGDGARRDLLVFHQVVQLT